MFEEQKTNQREWEERQIFLRHCSALDREILDGQRDMTKEDLCRISLRAEEMGLTAFETELILEYPDLLKEIGTEMEKEIENEVEKGR